MDRFAFGKNWQAFAADLDRDQLDQAIESLQAMLQLTSLSGKRFLDLGCGSGLFSLAAHQLGAEVVSLDFDRDSIACTEALRETHSNAQPEWRVLQGSLLDASLMHSLGQSEIVYCWGVVHHTGDMTRAIRLVSDAVSNGGRLFLAVYNDQGGASRRWLMIKRVYNRLPAWMQPLWVAWIAGLYEMKFAIIRLLQLRNPLPFSDWRQKKKDRGMSVWHDWVDWVGGLPFEVARPEQIIVPLREQGFVIDRLKTVGSGWGCNEYVFTLHASLSNSREAETA